MVTDVEDEELKMQMEELRLANQEVAGDDDMSGDDDAPLEEKEDNTALVNGD